MEKMEPIGREGMGGKFASSLLCITTNYKNCSFKLCPKLHNSVLLPMHSQYPLGSTRVGACERCNISQAPL